MLSTPKATDRVYDYLCPAESAVFRGAVCKVPFGKGNRECYGVVTEVTEEEPSMSLKAIAQVMPSEVALTEELLALCDYLQEQLFCTFGEAAKAILPSPVYQKSAKKIRFLSLPPDSDAKGALQGFRGKNKEKYLALTEYLSLVGTAEEKQCRELFELDGGAVSFLEKKGLIQIALQEEFRDPFLGVSREKEKPSLLSPLSPDQEKAFLLLREKADSGKAACALLHGVTGSGKTRVMLALCDHVLKKGKKILFLVPEIALTGQSARLLYRHYGDRVAILHSALSEGERRDSYVSIRNGEKDIVLGTRSAVFAPLDRIGLIVMDEEQDQSYKSDTQLKFHARDVARFRCAKNDAMLLLASATPDVESYYKAKKGLYTLVEMPRRFGNAVLPEVRIVDLRPEMRKNPGILLGSVLKEEIRRNLEKKEQTILLMNRRGYRRFVSCTDCGSVIRCPHCSVSLTLHNGETKRLSCHYCGYATSLPQSCPDCASPHLIPHGFGIQQLEEEIGKVFPEASLLRMDSDSLSGKNAHDQILSAFRRKEADILIGTQMVAKGHNFPDVTLVGIVMADSALYLSDFRAAEHAFSLLTQVIGRAGRAEKKGRAVIQTLNPRHNVFSMAAEQDFKSFFEGEIALRRAFCFPPFCQLAVFTLAHETETLLRMGTKKMSDTLQDALQNRFPDVKMIVYGPFDAPIYKMKNVFRKRFIIKFKNNARARALFRYLLETMNDSDRYAVRITVDIGPGMI